MFPSKQPPRFAVKVSEGKEGRDQFFFFQFDESANRGQSILFTFDELAFIKHNPPLLFFHLKLALHREDKLKIIVLSSLNKEILASACKEILLRLFSYQISFEF